eukprot:Skav223032  [mRNA]  locus=scaffold5:1821:20652:+ [translate_table: standard]
MAADTPLLSAAPISSVSAWDKLWRPALCVAVHDRLRLKARITGMGQDPEITFSKMTTADALVWFALRSPGQQVVGLNFANGQQVGGGYKNGAVAQEEDLCRRMPTLYTSLNNAKRETGVHESGARSRSRYAPQVLWTPRVCIARASEDLGYELLDEKQQVTVALVAAAAPNLKFADPPEPYDKVLMHLGRMGCLRLSHEAWLRLIKCWQESKQPAV